MSYIPKQTLQELNSDPLHIWVTGLALTRLFMHLNMCKHYTHMHTQQNKKVTVLLADVHESSDYVTLVKPV